MAFPPSYSWFYDTDRCPLDDNSPSEQTVTVTATSTSIYGVNNTPVSDDEDFKVVYDDPCCDPTLVTITVNPSLVAPLSDNYSGSNLIFDYGANAYTVEPSICQLSVVCEDVFPSNSNLPCQDLDGSDQLTWNFPDSLYTDKVNGIAPGTYTYTYSVQTCASVKELLTVPIMLTDPCTSVTVT